VDDLTQRRLVHNEQLFREVNEAREEAQPDARQLTVVCECALQECIERIRLTSEDYEAVRRVPNRFIIVPGHQVAEIERVVEERGAFAVVEKRLAA
jgi:hypothetical protein